jgi:Domain of unknown function (DUF1707)
MTNLPIRASDQERESVVDVLRDAYTDGRLTLDEFSERTSAAYAARTRPELRELTGDLPVQPVFGADLLRQRPAAELTPAGARRQARRDRPLGRLLPVVFAWILISAAAGSPDTAAALSVVFLCLLACRIGYGGRYDRE